jgi:hypothetical protein
MLAAACSDRASTPAAPSPAPPQPPPPAPGPGGSAFAIGLPIRAEDSRNSAFGVNPFGAHIGDHGIDGHPGWDLEYAPGSPVLAAAAGTVQSVLPAEGGASNGIQITHVVEGREAFRTIYGVGTLAAGIEPGATIAKGRVLGTVSSYTRTIGTITVTYGFTHFQLDDFSRNEGLTNQHAVSPETFLDAEAASAFDAIWRQAAYGQELVEPFMTNPRNTSFPMSRTWTRGSGAHAASVGFTRMAPSANEFSYAMRDAAGTVLETGTATLEVLARPLSFIDLLPDTGGSRRRGVYAVTSDMLQLDYGAPGAARPSTLAAASTYTTAR